AKKFICSIELFNISNFDKMKLIPSKALLSYASGSKTKDFITCTIILLLLIGVISDHHKKYD
ncbi:CD166 antigen, partial [Aphis craccivora]